MGGRKGSASSREPLPGATRFFNAVRQFEPNWGNELTLSELKKWIAGRPEDDRVGDAARALTTYLRGGGSQPKTLDLLSAFCNEKFNTTYAPDYFGNERRAEDHAATFAIATADKGTRCLREFAGEYLMLRAGTDELMKTVRESPQWEDPQFRMEICDVGDGTRFEFRYFKANSNRGWSGSALSCGSYIYLVGYDTTEPNIDVALFTMTRHEDVSLGKDVLVGVQLCNLELPDNRHGAVARRIVGVRESAMARSQGALLKAAQDWITSSEFGLDGMGIVIPWRRPAKTNSRHSKD